MVISMERWNGKVALVTGASAGIGAAIATQLVQAGLKVVGFARRKERTEALAKKLQGNPGKLYAVQGDITKEEDVVAAFKWTKENVGPIQILVNNAGIIRRTELIDGNVQMWKDVLDTNVLGLCIATKEGVKQMRDNNLDGHIVHINSIVGHRVPNMAEFNVYPASKHAVTALTETLRHELNALKSNIKITSVSPGATQSEIMQATGQEIPARIQEYINRSSLKVEDVADAVMYALSTAPHVQVQEVTVSHIREPL